MRSGNFPSVIKSWGIQYWGIQGSLNIQEGPLGTKSESWVSAGSSSSDHLIYRVDHLVDLPWARSVEDPWELGILIQDPFYTALL
jgi:hypothetical protein